MGMFSIDFGDFLNNLLSFGFNTVQQIYFFLTFRDLQDVKQTLYFWHVIFSGNRRP
jgi:hypothetical protein